MKALFLDRDGVINVDVGYGYRKEQIEFIPEIFQLTKKFSDAGYAIVIVTNQAGIGRGYYTEADFFSLTKWMVKKFASNQVPIASVKYCPHHPQASLKAYQIQCNCRKPEPGMLNDAIVELGIEAPQSVMIGDKATDMLAGYRSGLRTLYLLNNQEEYDSLPNGIRDHVVLVSCLSDISV